jgi:hypothetical protein
MAGPTRSKKNRVFYAAADAVGDIAAYVESSRAWAVREAQRKGRYEMLPEAQVVTGITQPVLSASAHPVMRFARERQARDKPRLLQMPGEVPDPRPVAGEGPFPVR